MLITFDGPDGAGKTTQIGLFVDWLRGRGDDVVTCRDPGSTWLGDRLRELLLSHGQGPIGRTAEMFLYMAARAELVEEVIRPALSAGRTVVSDRFLLANVVYQGHAGGLHAETLWEVGRVATGGLEPDLTFILDLPPEVAQARIQRVPDRMESQGDDYRRRVREGFLAEAQRRPGQIVVVDATGTVDEVANRIRQIAEARLAARSRPGGG